jgi:CRP-like cAMP-binding protein
MSDDVVDLLRNVSIFRGVGDPVLQRVAGRLRRRSYRRGEVIFHHGDPAGALHIVKSGRVKIHSPSEEGEETVLTLYHEGECFGEMAALDGGPRSTSATAVEPTETLTLLREDLLALLREDADLALAIIQELIARLRRTNASLEEAYYLSLDARMARRLLELAETQGRETADGVEVPFPLTQQDLAGMLGVTRVSVNRLLGTFQDDRLIRLNKGSFTVLDMEALRDRARL